MELSGAGVPVFERLLQERNPSLGRLEGRASEVANHAAQIAGVKVLMAELLSVRTGQRVDQIQQDWDRERWFSAPQALADGMIDRAIATAGTARTAAAEGSSAR